MKQNFIDNFKRHTSENGYFPLKVSLHGFLLDPTPVLGN